MPGMILAATKATHKKTLPLCNFATLQLCHFATLPLYH
jgi:hypothetical protein